MTKSSLSRLIFIFNIILVSSLIHFSHCVKRQKRVLTLPEEIGALNTQMPYLKAHMKNGDVYILNNWQVSDDEKLIQGQGERLNFNREILKSGDLVIWIDSVSIFESNTLSNSPSVAALTLLTGVSLGVTIYCISDPKACFGSCPTFYSEVNGTEQLVAEGFSSSVAPSLEQTDVDALFQIKPTSDKLNLTVRNEALETHMIRSAELYAMHKNGGRIFKGIDKKYYQCDNIITPYKAYDENGDCLKLIENYDLIERFSLADSTDLNTKEYINLEFTDIPAGEIGIIIGCRQSLMSTFLFYQTLAYMGTSASKWISYLENNTEEFKNEIDGVGRELGGIEVLVKINGSNFKSAGEINETGPLARDIHLLKLPEFESSELRVKLKVAKGNWRIDYVALVELDQTVEPLIIPPIITDNNKNYNIENDILNDPNQYLITLPGDEYTLSYKLPSNYEEFEYFLVSSGYYLEWIRDQWLEDENSELAMMMFLNPRDALKYLAPHYKQVESEMEEYFWNSKYVKQNNY